MRNDMSKVVAEPYRRGPRLKQPKSYKKVMGKFDENSPKSESIARKWKEHWADTKESSYLSGPIERYLIKQLGRKFDDVLHEIYESMDMRRRQNKILLDRIHRRVEDELMINEEGKCVSVRHGSEPWGFYVHPESGVLCHKQDKRYKPKTREEKFPHIIVVREDLYYIKHEGLWFSCTMRGFKYEQRENPVVIGKYRMYIPDRTECIPAYDVLQHKTLAGYEASYRYYGAAVFCAEKKSLSSREIRKLKLNAKDVK